MKHHMQRALSGRAIYFFTISNLADTTKSGKYEFQVKIKTNKKDKLVVKFSRNYTKFTMLSFLYCFIVKGKLI